MPRSERSRHARASQTVLIVDRDQDYCSNVREALERAGFTCRQVSTGEEALAFARGERPAAVVLNVILPGANGYDVCRQLREAHGDDLPIVFASGERTDPADRVAGLLIGGDDYLLKPYAADELIARLRRLIARAAARRSGSRRDVFADLTMREAQVLRLLAEGLTQEGIAAELEISPATVGTHIQRILNKLDVHSRTQAVALAYRERLVERV